jgi:hypothetical protein
MLSLKVEAGVGDDVRDTMLSMLKLARHMDMMITTKFNGLHIYIAPNDEYRDLEQRYYCAVEKDMKTLPIRDTRWD